MTVSDSVATPAPGRAPQVFGDIPQRNKNFTGREDILALLRSDLAKSVTVVYALQGLGGIGKTQVAIEYAYRYSQDYELISWIPADHLPLVRSSLAALAPKLGLPPATASGTGIEGTAKAVLDALRRGQPFGRWLLIFDNADQPEDLDDVMPRGGPGHVLITSRNNRWDSKAEIVQVDVFTPDESIEFLSRRMRGDLDRDAAHALAAELGYLPLALEQAGALQAETGMSIEEYLRLLKQHSVSIMAEGRSADYPLSVTAAWKLSVSTLGQYQAEAVELLRCCAFLGPEPIPRDLFSTSAHALQPPLRDLLADPIRLARAIGGLGRFALVRLDGRTMVIHRLIQALLRDDLEEEEQKRYREEAHLVLAAGVPGGGPDDDKLRPRYAELVAHVASPVTQLEQSRNETVRKFAVDIIRYLSNSGDLDTAKSFADRFIGAWEPVITEGDPQLLRAQLEKANALRLLGRYDDAYELDEKTRDVATRTLGERDKFTLWVTNGFGADMRARGDFAGALALDEKSLADHREVIGREDPQTLRVANNLAVDYALNSRYPEARDLHKETYRLRKERSDIPAQDRLSSLSGLARALRLCGDYGAARDVGQDAYDLGVAELGPEHQRTLEAAIDLSIALRRIAVSSYTDAAELAQQVYEQARRRFGQFAPLTLASMVSLTNIQRTSSEIGAALDRGKEAAEQYGAQYGTGHPYYFGCLGNVALLYRVSGNLRRARELNEQALEGLDQRLSRDHHYTLTVAVNLASDLAGVGELDNARALGEGSLRRLRVVLGERHPLTLGCAANLVGDLRTAGELAAADELFTTTIEHYRETLGADHPDTVAAAEGRRLDFDFDTQQI